MLPLIWRTLQMLLLIRVFVGGFIYPEIEHNLWRYQKPLPKEVNGSTIPDSQYITPDWRIEEPPYRVHIKNFYLEEQRPYRISPHYKTTLKWSKGWTPWGHGGKAFGGDLDNPQNFGCYCTTVFKRLTMLAGCAVITTRHILTTASSTELVLKDRRNENTLENILGFWYDTNANTFNSSIYGTPARIHYHPKYLRVNLINSSHPLPFVYDLSIWAATYPFQGSWWSWSTAVVCARGSPHSYDYRSSTPRPGELSVIIGYQFMKAYKRIPMPWYKYAVKTRRRSVPCPKSDWAWFHCIPECCSHWSKYGLESGAALHRCLEGYSWCYDGLIGMNAFSLKLRSHDLNHYFTVLNTHPVLDWMYTAYMGRLQYEWLDWRFYDTQWAAPVPKPWFRIPWDYTAGVEKHYDDTMIPFYRK